MMQRQLGGKEDIGRKTEGRYRKGKGKRGLGDASFGMQLRERVKKKVEGGAIASSGKTGSRRTTSSYGRKEERGEKGRI